MQIISLLSVKGTSARFELVDKVRGLIKSKKNMPKRLWDVHFHSILPFQSYLPKGDYNVSEILKNIITKSRQQPDKNFLALPVQNFQKTPEFQLENYCSQNRIFDFALVTYNSRTAIVEIKTFDITVALHSVTIKEKHAKQMLVIQPPLLISI